MTDPFTSPDSDNPTVDGRTVKRDRYGRYLLPHPTDEDGNEISWTRATTFASTLSDTYSLNKWSERMLTKGLTLRPDLYAQAASVPLDDRDQLNKIAEQAKEAAGSKTAATMGTAIHSFTEQVDGPGEDPVVPHPWDRDIAAYKELVTSAGFEFPSWGIERIVVIPEYQVAGTFDRIVRLTKPITVKFPKKDPIHLEAGTWSVGDVKTKQSLNYGTDEIAIQLALYSRAKVMWNGSTGQYEPMPDVNQQVAFVFHLPAGKATAKLYAIDIELGWEASKLCQQVRTWRKLNGLAVEIPVNEPTWEEKIATATSRADLSRIWKEATRRGEWTPELENLGKQRAKDL